MREIIFNAVDNATLMADAKNLGFIDSNGNLVTNGTFVSGGGWFLNIIGTVFDSSHVARPGYWGRLRLNGTPDALPAFSSAITQYTWVDSLNGWSSDGSTVAPNWVSTIGLIA
jgi:hypothetical protein